METASTAPSADRMAAQPSYGDQATEDLAPGGLDPGGQRRRRGRIRGTLGGVRLRKPRAHRYRGTQRGQRMDRIPPTWRSLTRRTPPSREGKEYV